MRSPLRNAFAFFLAHAGYCTPPGRAVCALSLAKAEQRAEDNGLSIQWEEEEYPDTSWMDARARRDYGAGRLEIWCGTCRDASGNVLASLGDVTGSFGNHDGRDYLRVVEAELYAEALSSHYSAAWSA